MPGRPPRCRLRSHGCVALGASWELCGAGHQEVDRCCGLLLEPLVGPVRLISPEHAAKTFKAFQTGHKVAFSPIKESTLAWRMARSLRRVRSSASACCAVASCWRKLVIASVSQARVLACWNQTICSTVTPVSTRRSETLGGILLLVSPLSSGGTAAPDVIALAYSLTMNVVLSGTPISYCDVC